MTKIILYAVMLSTILLTSTVSVSIPPASASTNLIVNGSFEDPDCGPITTWVTLFAGSLSLAGWTIDSGSIDHMCTFWQATDGTRSVDLSGNSAASISQSFPTIAGKTYDVSFDMAGNMFCGSPIKLMTVNAPGYSNQFAFDTTGNTVINMGYETNMFSFVATSASSTVEFTSNENSACGPVLDNVVITEIVPLVTEVTIDVKPGSDPSSWNCKNAKGGIPVAVFSTADFDASTIDLTTLTIDGIPTFEVHNKVHVEDKNGDGLNDAVLHLDSASVCEAADDIPLKETGFVTLAGSTTTGDAFEGTGDIRIVQR